MKLKLKYIFFFLLIINYTIPVYAASRYAVLLDAVNIRSGPGTNYSRYELGKIGSSYNLKNNNIVADSNHNGTCDAGWYEIDYNGKSAYVCSDYARIYEEGEDEKTNPTTACEAELKAEGFPASYWTGLCNLKAKHPSWTFKAIKTNLDWASAVDKESACGINLVQTNNSEYIDKSCNHGYSNWKAPSQKALAFYMDPRNFLTEQYIFQFEYLKYDNSIASSYPSSIANIIKNASFYSYHANRGLNLENTISEAGRVANVNPVFLASRMLQELGTSTTLYNLYSGAYTGNSSWTGYYNFYNIGVYDSCATASGGTTKCGLEYAVKMGWNSPYNAIKGGADFLSQGYIAKGQYTTYLQKYNVIPTEANKLFAHQYMENIAAPSSEAGLTYNAYKKLNMLETAFAFYIPVYTNMSASIVNSSNGASGEATSSPSSDSLTNIISNAGYKSTGDYLTSILPGSDINVLKANLESSAGSGNVTITNANGAEITKGTIGTGCKVTIKNINEQKTFQIVIKGDTSGDGVVNALDLLQIQKSILGTYNLNGAYGKAADPSNDNKINALDLLQVQKNILGTYNIVQ